MSKPSWTNLAWTCAGAAVLFGLTAVQACAKADDEPASTDAGASVDAAPDVSKEASAGGSAGEAGSGGDGGAAGTAGKGGSPGKGGSGGGTGGAAGEDAGEAPDGSVACGSAFCFAMACVPDAGIPTFTMEPCCTDTNECGVVVLSVNCVTPTQAQGLGFTCTPK